MTDLTLICELCSRPIHSGDGCLYALHSDINRAGRDDTFEAPWHTGHFIHPEVRAVSAYAIGASEIQAWPHVARWTAHLMEKGWFALTDWDELMRELSGESAPRRIRALARDAA